MGKILVMFVIDEDKLEDMLNADEDIDVDEKAVQDMTAQEILDVMTEDWEEADYTPEIRVWKAASHHILDILPRAEAHQDETNG